MIRLVPLGFAIGAGGFVLCAVLAVLLGEAIVAGLLLVLAAGSWWLRGYARRTIDPGPPDR
jgi:hypothetical protein